MVERCPDKTEVGGSIPPMRTFNIFKIRLINTYFTQLVFYSERQSRPPWQTGPYDDTKKQQ